jgi:DNA-binding winged helix-turn-helix (wHTH) protein
LQPAAERRRTTDVAAPISRFLLGEWQVHVDRHLLVGPTDERRVEPKEMALLAMLAGRAGEVVAKDELLRELWPGRHVVEHVLPKTVSGLRLALGDDARAPRYLETVNRRGYRLCVEPRPWAVDPAVPGVPNTRRTSASAAWNASRRFRGVVAVLFAVFIGAVTASLAERLDAPTEVVGVAPAIDGSVVERRLRAGLVQSLVERRCLSVAADPAHARFTVEAEVVADERGRTLRARLLAAETGRYALAVEVPVEGGVAAAASAAARLLIVEIEAREPQLCALERSG